MCFFPILMRFLNRDYSISVKKCNQNWKKEVKTYLRNTFKYRVSEERACLLYNHHNTATQHTIFFMWPVVCLYTCSERSTSLKRTFVLYCQILTVHTHTYTSQILATENRKWDNIFATAWCITIDFSTFHWEHWWVRWLLFFLCCYGLGQESAWLLQFLLAAIFAIDFEDGASFSRSHFYIFGLC